MAMTERIVIRQVQNPTKDTTQRAGIVLGAAFEQDLVTVLLLGGNRTLAAPHMEANFKCGLLRGSAYLASFSKDGEYRGWDADEIVGVALWCEPGQLDIEIADQVPERATVNALIAPEAHAWRQDVFFPLYKALLDKCIDPERRCGLYHLHSLGVHPSARRRGIASALVRHGLDIADKAGIATALDTGAPENIPLYESLGFRVLGQTIIPSASGEILMTCMLRPVGG